MIFFQWVGVAVTVVGLAALLSTAWAMLKELHGRHGPYIEWGKPLIVEQFDGEYVWKIVRWGLGFNRYHVGVSRNYLKGRDY